MIDKDNAPEGFYAVADRRCLGCAFLDEEGECDCPIETRCYIGRPDGTSVIFKKKEAPMSKIYSAVDAEDAEHLIGKEVFCGDTLNEIKAQGKKGILKTILSGYNNFRFLVHGTAMDNWNLIQEAGQPTYRKIETIEEAETFFGKVARKKDGTDIFTVVNAYLLQGEILIIGEWTAEELLENYTIDGKPFGIES